MNQKLLLTGANGFLGQHFHTTLKEKFVVKTLGRGNSNHYPIDLSTDQPVFGEAFDWVIHNAGKAHIVPRTQEESEAFFRVNVEGTKNLLAALEKTAALPRQFIFISTIAVYGRESGENIGEHHPLEGTTPYAKSKIMAEAAVREWCTLHSVRYLILRLPLVVGHQPPGNLGAIARAIQKGYYFRIKGNAAHKSAVLAEDVAQLIPRLEGKQGIYNLTDGVHSSFSDLESALAKVLQKRIHFTLPLALVGLLSKLGDVLERAGLPAPLTSLKLQKMTASLTFNDDKAKQELSWKPRPVVPWIAEGGLGN